MQPPWGISRLTRPGGRGRGASTDPVPGAVSPVLALLVAGCYFMEVLDATIVAPAAPSIADDLSIPAVRVNVVITAYVLTLAVLIPVSGWLSDRLGARRVMMTAIAAFTLASVGCALASDLPVLTSMRVLQGVGGAMMVPVGRLVVLRSTAKEHLLTAIAYLTWPALVAPVVAPAIGGLLSTYASWRWIFLVNVPLGVAAVAAAGRVVTDVREAAGSALDWRGAVLTATGVAALIVGLDAMGATEPDWSRAVGGSVVAGLVLLAAVIHLLRSANPLLDLRVLRVLTYRVSASSGTCFRAVITAVPFLFVLFMQLGMGWSAVRAGFVLIALFAGNLVVKPATTPLLRRFGIRRVMLGSVVASALCLLGVATVASSTPLFLLVGLLGLSGVSRSVGFTSFNSLAFADVDAERMTHANTLMSTLQELAAGLGVAVGALLVRLGATVAGPIGLTQDPTVAFRVSFVALAAFLLLPAVGAFRLPPDAGRRVTG